MTLATASPPVVRALVRKLRQEPAHGRVVGVRAQPVWSHPAELTVDGAAVRVRACISPLAVREALVEQQDADGGYLVVLTDCTDADLGAGIRARLARRQLISVDLWHTVQESFRAPHVDAAFVRRDKAWAPRALVDHEPAAGWPEAPGGSLTRDVALSHLAGVVLGLHADLVDATSLLGWSRDPVAVRRWLDLAEDVRVGLGAWLGERTGAAGMLTLRAAEAGPGSDVVPLALVADLLWHPGADPAAVGMARGLLAARLGGQAPLAAQAQAWGRTATLYAAASSPTRRRPVSSSSSAPNGCSTSSAPGALHPSRGCCPAPWTSGCAGSPLRSRPRRPRPVRRTCPTSSTPSPTWPSTNWQQPTVGSTPPSWRCG